MRYRLGRLLGLPILALVALAVGVLIATSNVASAGDPPDGDHPAAQSVSAPSSTGSSHDPDGDGGPGDQAQATAQANQTTTTSSSDTSTTPSPPTGTLTTTTTQTATTPSDQGTTTQPTPSQLTITVSETSPSGTVVQQCTITPGTPSPCTVKHAGDTLTASVQSPVPITTPTPPTAPTLTKPVQTTPTTTTPTTTTTPPPTPAAAVSAPGGAVVAAAPLGVPAPAGGWSVRYADAFGSCFTDPGTACTSGLTRADATLKSLTHANGAGNANEIAAFVPGENDVTANGLVERCDTKPALGDSVSCGSMVGGSSSSTAFHWNPGSGHWVMQWVGQLPPNEGNMDPAVWATGTGYAWEIDFPEFWGWSHYPTGANTWCGYSFTFPGAPKDNGGGTGQTPVTFCQTPGLNFDPSAGFHTYTLDMNGGNMTGYVDGVQVTNHNLGQFSSIPGQVIFQNDLRANNTSRSRTDPHFPAAGNQFTVRSIAFYAPAGANGADNGPIIVPGTTVR